MKSLLDILMEEKSVSDQINVETDRIDRLAKDIKQIQNIQPDCELKQKDIQRLTTEREIVTSNRNLLMQDLDEVRYELKLYFERMFDKR